jgi:formate-dependent phosphoribosylglycinamide formyltransferase (GAR transformylase)
VVAPARVSPAVAARARAVAQRAVASLPGAIGIFGVELFLLADGSVVLNELAPRPHNSGHYTMEACVVDQFENHLRAVLGLPLGSGAMVAAHAIMVNVLGEDSMEGTLAPLNKVRDAKMGSAEVSVQAIIDNSTNRSRVFISTPTAFTSSSLRPCKMATAASTGTGRRPRARVARWPT